MDRQQQIHEMTLGYLRASNYRTGSLEQYIKDYKDFSLKIEKALFQPLESKKQ